MSRLELFGWMYLMSTTAAIVVLLAADEGARITGIMMAASAWPLILLAALLTVLWDAGLARRRTATSHLGTVGDTLGPGASWRQTTQTTTDVDQDACQTRSEKKPSGGSKI